MIFLEWCFFWNGEKQTLNAWRISWLVFFWSDVFLDGVGKNLDRVRNFSTSGFFWSDGFLGRGGKILDRVRNFLISDFFGVMVFWNGGGGC